jgi:hypothetical protein
MDKHYYIDVQDESDAPSSRSGDCIMINSPVSKTPGHWTEAVVVFAVAAGAALSCVVCIANGDADACLGILMVSGMALVGVIGSRYVVSPTSSVRRRDARRQGVPYLTCVSTR